MIFSELDAFWLIILGNTYAFANLITLSLHVGEAEKEPPVFQEKNLHLKSGLDTGTREPDEAWLGRQFDGLAEGILSCIVTIIIGKREGNSYVMTEDIAIELPNQQAFGQWLAIS